jgi:NAD-dependent dihydropyrimidine dehydrogenase PreA subunit
MGHITAKGYYDLQKRLDKAAQGAPESESLYKILEVLFTKKEAELVSILPLNFFTVEEAAKRWKKSKKESKKVLDELADKAIILDLKKGKTQAYLIAPTMAGFFEFSLMRLDNKFNKKVLSELFYQYINTEEEFIRMLFMQNPPLGRVFVQEDVVQPKHETVVLDYEKASEVIKKASCICVGICYCRHKMEHMGKACNMPQEVCLTFNKAAESLVKHKVAKKISKKEAMKILNKCIKLGLVQFGDNIQDDVNFICNCCACCCEAIIAYNKFGYREGLSTTNFFTKVNKKKCSGCGICVKKCPVNAIVLNKSGTVNVDGKLCIGCGVCIRFCPTNALFLEKKSERSFVPKDIFERMVLSAIDTGKLQNYIFDNPNLVTHSLLRRLFGTILNLKPTKRLLAMKQLRSRFLNKLIKTKHYTIFDKLYNNGKKVDYSHKELDKKR